MQPQTELEHRATQELPQSSEGRSLREGGQSLRVRGRILRAGGGV